jgi:hypothetical protein
MRSITLLLFIGDTPQIIPSRRAFKRLSTMRGFYWIVAFRETIAALVIGILSALNSVNTGSLLSLRGLIA